jgi:hypothetical protein
MDFIISIIVFILIFLLLIIIKPKFIYNKKTKKFRSFGIGKNKTLLPLPILSIFISVIVFLIIYFFRDSCYDSSNISVTNNIPLNNIPVTNNLSSNIPNISHNLLGGLTLPPGFDINSIIEAGIKAKLMEQLNN